MPADIRMTEWVTLYEQSDCAPAEIAKMFAVAEDTVRYALAVYSPRFRRAENITARNFIPEAAVEIAQQQLISIATFGENEGVRARAAARIIDDYTGRIDARARRDQKTSGGITVIQNMNVMIEKMKEARAALPKAIEV